MGWIENRIAERGKLLDENRRIEQAFDAIWDGLWKEITKHVETFRATYGEQSVVTGGSYEERYVATPSLRMGMADRRATLRADKNKHSVDGTVHFAVKVCKDGVVCLVDGDRELSLEQAAICVLDPVLFPDLPRIAV